MNTENKSIGIFIDGGYFAKINEALEDNLSLNIQIKPLFQFIRTEIARRNELDLSDCYITESHYFRGRYRVNDANSKQLLFKERKFEDTLIENDVIFHYKHLREVQKDGDITVIEKGVDVWFALEAYELSLFRNFDFVVLITGDSLKVHVVLLTWNVTEQSATAKLLREEACTHIEMSDMIAEDKELLDRLCRKV